MSAVRSVALIGSFRRHYDEILAVWSLFTGAGLAVTSPKGTRVREEGVEFVRFESDPAIWDDPKVQTVALHRIMRADFVYVVAPLGYVGRTTSYEIGRVIQTGRPVYFSEPVQDLPIHIPRRHILKPQALLDGLARGDLALRPLYDRGYEYSRLEADLLYGIYREDFDLE